ncbi:ArsR/SmtB family transcription factor [Bradyrhizobium australiense]|uniref:Winged helix-turn-helix transcriptional regulator n=1 Tax=Bradyrhizobium australiense TaxID=2721161 RepID=A0A7Y4GY67_9BRAD|nr:metalloregulator ArsR/SmtB family transcription factor [Bradyrhizobium australiense]NOJ44133.1 winged helix-turn-helix transcriptional regulator [Bradyrhizobium australiense]
MRAAATAAQGTQQGTQQETQQEAAFVPGGDDATALKKLAKQAGDAAQLLKMLANEKRLLILCFLAVRGEMTVGELVGVVKLSQSALSQHLAKLRADGLVEFRRTSQTLHYRVADQRTLRLLRVLKEIFCGDLK